MHSNKATNRVGLRGNGNMLITRNRSENRGMSREQEILDKL